ncbi:MAG: hypothetical protein LBT91_01540, partial [Bifidobacteriaceae bacterium]|nr:hypothetical protein [Bifidobacteriaceae bacterium]
FTYFICKDFDKKTVKHYRPHIFRLLKLSKDNFPLMIRSGAFWIIILLSLWCFSILGTQYVAAGQLGDAIVSFAMYAFDALAAAAQTLVGEARGSKNQNRILEIIHRTRRLSRLFIPAVIVFYLAGGWVLTHLMTDDITVSDLSFLLILLSLIPLPIIS